MKRFTLVFIAVLTVLIFTGCKGAGQDPAPDPVTYAIGDTGPAGGLIFYIDEFDAFSWDYLEAAPSDQNGGSAIAWSNITATASGATDTTIGFGQANTTTIIGQAGCSAGAAYLCNELEITNGGVLYADWFLPSQEEMGFMYTNLHQQSVGDFTATPYWTSSEHMVTANAAIIRYFSTGGTNSTLKSLPQLVRAARAF